MLQVQNLSFSFKRSREVLSDVSFTAEHGSVTAIVGPNGCGKTTLIKCVNAILRPGGAVTLDDLDLLRTPRSVIARKVGYVPQYASIAPRGTVMDFLLLGRRAYLGWRVRSRDIDAVLDVLARLNLVELANREYSELSGGQRQQILVARALLQEPSLYLFDEPTSALDIRNQLQIMNLASSIGHAEGRIVVVVLHDLSMALRYADTVIVLSDGRVKASGPSGDVITPNMIREVYGVEARVEKDGYVNPLREAPR